MWCFIIPHSGERDTADPYRLPRDKSIYFRIFPGQWGQTTVSHESTSMWWIQVKTSFTLPAASFITRLSFMSVEGFHDCSLDYFRKSMYFQYFPSSTKRLRKHYINNNKDYICAEKVLTSLWVLSLLKYCRAWAYISFRPGFAPETHTHTFKMQWKEIITEALWIN